MTTLDDDADMRAAEYVLGTLDPAERAEAFQLCQRDPSFAGAVTGWEQRLLALSEATPEQQPSPAVWSAIRQRLAFESSHAGEGATSSVRVLHRAVRRWRLATMAVSALAACLAAVVTTTTLRPTPAPSATLIAVLAKSGSEPAYLMRTALDARSVDVKAFGAAPPSGRSYELWIIDPALGTPRSLGLVDASTSAHPLPPGVGADVIARATYAVTDEPLGGSPSGTPSGTPLFAGHLVSTSF